MNLARNRLPLVFCSILFAAGLSAIRSVGQDAQLLRSANSRVVKIFGSGGFSNLHSYQTGVFISSSGEILTAWSHVLDGDVVVVDFLGNRFTATFSGVDPVAELALLKIKRTNCPFFELDHSTKVFPGKQVYGISNLFKIANKNETLSVMKGAVSATTSLSGTSAQFETPYKGKVIVVDLITNNPGAAGGAVVDSKGNLIGLIGKELKDKQTGVWLNYCLPVEELSQSISTIKDSKNRPPANAKPVPSPFDFSEVGLALVPNVVKSTRPFVDRTQRNSAARKMGFKPDDLILFLNDSAIRNIDELESQLKAIDRDSIILLTVKRGNEIIKLKLSRRGLQ